MSSSRRILLLGDTLNVGGTENQFAMVVRNLDRQRWSTEVACLRAEGPLRASLEAAGIQPWSCGRGSFRSLKGLAAIPALAKVIREKEISLVHAFDHYSNLLALPAGRLARIHVLTSQRDLGDVRSPARQRLQRFILGLSDGVIVNAAIIATRLRAERGPRLPTIDVVANAVDVERFPFRVARERAGTGPTVGTLCNLRPEKGLDHFLEAAVRVLAQVPRARFVVWGDGPLRPVLHDAAVSRGLGEVFELRGRTDRPERVLPELDVFVLASTQNEGCSNALLEAMAVGLPAIATRVGGSTELIRDGETGVLVDPADPEGLAAAILRLLREPQLAAALGLAARRWVETNHGIAPMIAKLERVYTRHLERPPP